MSEDTITITSNWSQSNGSLSVTHVASAKDIDLDTMTPEACVLLSPLDGEDERCQVVLSGPVDSIVVITDCPRWEVVGNIQYLFSCSGKIIEEVEDSKIFSVEVSLKKHSFDKITLRLPPTAKACWIYSVFVEKKCSPSAPNSQHFDLKNINNLMSSSSKLSSNAEQFKTLFDTFQSSASHNIPQMGMIPKSMPNSSGDSSTDLPLLKFYIDKKFLELEDKLTKKIEQNAKVQNDKLDTIIKLLEHQRSMNL